MVEQDQSKPSLYETNGEKPPHDATMTGRPDSPGTTLTASVETVDNDRAENLRGVGIF